jgi:hypothetical protein
MKKNKKLEIQRQEILNKINEIDYQLNGQSPITFSDTLENSISNDIVIFKTPIYINKYDIINFANRNDNKLINEIKLYKEYLKKNKNIETFYYQDNIIITEKGYYIALWRNDVLCKGLFENFYASEVPHISYDKEVLMDSWFLSLVIGMKIEINSIDPIDVDYYSKNGDILFNHMGFVSSKELEINKAEDFSLPIESFFIDTKNVYNVIIMKFYNSLNNKIIEKEIYDFIKNMANKYLKITLKYIPIQDNL